LILMDVRMPRMNGLEATRAIRASSNGKGPVILALSASALDDDRDAALRSGVDDFLAKPCKESDLLAMIQAHLKVGYLYAEEETSRGTEPAVTRASALNPAVLAQLPAELIDKLQQAVLNGDTDGLGELIQRVAEYDRGASDALKELADNYQYDRLTGMLQERSQELGVMKQQ